MQEVPHAKAQRRNDLLFRLLCAFAPLREGCLFLILSATLTSAQTSAVAQTARNVAPSIPAVEAPPAGPLSDDSDKYSVETVAKDLDNPSALALRPNTPTAAPFELFISESGAGRVVRVFTDKPSEVELVVTGFSRAKFGENPSYNIGPLGLEFITRSKLAVGTGGLPEGEDIVQVYELPPELTAMGHDKAAYHVGPIPAGGRSKNGEGNFFGIARTPEDEAEKALFVTSAADKEKGWVLKADIAANRLGDLHPFIMTKQVTGVGIPTAVTVNPKLRNHYLVVAQMGRPDGDRDSVVAFYGPASGEPAMVLKTDMYDITGLAYSPSGDLYVTDFAWAKPEAGGVYRLEAAEVDGRQSCRAVKIASTMRPTALAFTPDGVLYVTAMGERKSLDEAPKGVLLKIKPREGTPQL